MSRDVTVNLLLVDDSATSLAALETLLAPLGQRLVTAQSGEAALKHLLREDFALILLDVQMPGMDGFETAKLIKEHERLRHVPIIFLTAGSLEEQHLSLGYDVGAVDYLQKPFVPRVLRSKVSVFVELCLHRKNQVDRMEQLRREDQTRARLQHDEHFHTVLDAMPDSAWFTDAAGAVLFRNRAWLEYSGQSVPGVEQRSPEQLVHEEDAATARRLWARAMTDGEAFESDMRLRRWDGDFRWHHVRVQPQRDENGRVQRWLTSAIDVEEPRRAALEQRVLARMGAVLAEPGETERALGAVASCMVPSVTDACALDLWKPGQGMSRAAEVYASPALAANGREIDAFCESELAPENGLYPRHANASRPPGAPVGSALCVPLVSRGRSLGQMRWVNALGARRLDAQDLMLAQELARRVAMALDNSSLLAGAREAVRARDAFITVCAHELRTPLTPLLLSVQSARELLCQQPGLVPTQVVAKLERAEQQTRRFAELISKMLTLSAPALQTGTYLRESVDLVEVVHEVLETAPEIRRIPGGSGVQVHAPGPVHSDADRGQLLDVVRNLLVNACKYGLGNPVHVTVESVEDRARIRVQDHGIGIADRDQGRIFERFGRAASEKNYGGLGVGLWSARKALAHMGGAIDVESSPGKGSTFTITLPRSSAGSAPS